MASGDTIELESIEVVEPTLSMNSAPKIQEVTNETSTEDDGK